MSDFLIPFYFAVDRISVGNIFGLGIQIYLLWYVVLNTTKHMCVYIIMQGYMKDWNLLFSERKKKMLQPLSDYFGRKQFLPLKDRVQVSYKWHFRYLVWYANFLIKLLILSFVGVEIW